MVELQNVSINFDNRPILHNVSLNVLEGEVLAIVGESGVGKTTLLRAIAGLVDVEGEIIFNTKKVIGPSERLVPGVEGVATIFQDYKLMHNRTVYENISYPFRAYVEEEQQQYTDRLVALLKLDSHKDHYPQELSGGQKQRVSIARALAEEPTLLLMDEPFSNIDVALKEIIKERIFNYLKEEGITAVLVTHEPKDALSTSNKIAVIQKGEIFQHDIPHEIYDAPLSQYVMSCFGQCNIWGKEGYETDFRLSISHDIASIAIRVEDLLHVSKEDSDFEVKVMECLYQGTGYLIKSISRSKNFIYFYSKKPLESREVISLKLDPLKIQYFKEEQSSL